MRAERRRPVSTATVARINSFRRAASARAGLEPLLSRPVRFGRGLGQASLRVLLGAAEDLFALAPGFGEDFPAQCFFRSCCWASPPCFLSLADADAHGLLHELSQALASRPGPSGPGISTISGRDRASRIASTCSRMRGRDLFGQDDDAAVGARRRSRSGPPRLAAPWWPLARRCRPGGTRAPCPHRQCKKTSHVASYIFCSSIMAMAKPSTASPSASATNRIVRGSSSGFSANAPTAADPIRPTA